MNQAYTNNNVLKLHFRKRFDRSGSDSSDLSQPNQRLHAAKCLAVYLFLLHNTHTKVGQSTPVQTPKAMCMGKREQVMSAGEPTAKLTVPPGINCQTAKVVHQDELESSKSDIPGLITKEPK